MDHNLETTLAVTQEMADELTDYLMDGDLYRQMMVRTAEGMKQPKMTLGALLENIQTLHWRKDELDSQQRAALSDIEEKTDIARNGFSDSWNALLRRELKALMDSWKWYLEDAARDENARENYASESRIRTRIDLVMRALDGKSVGPAERKELTSLDDRLKEMMEPGDYVGPAGEQALYPRDKAWWLYGEPTD